MDSWIRENPAGRHIKVSAGPMDWNSRNGLTSLIIPFYNPGPLLPRTCQRLLRFLTKAPGRWELLLVCDGCTDNSKEQLQHWASTLDHPTAVQILSYEKNQGKGYAVCHGLAQANGAYRIFTDVDLAYSFASLLKVAQSLWSGHRAVIASRFHPDTEVRHPRPLKSYVFRRHLQSRLFSQLVHWLLPLRFKDTQAGLKGFHASVVQQLLPLVATPGFEFDCELLTACVHLGIPVKEIPVLVRYDSSRSTTNLRQTLAMVQGVYRIRQTWRAASIPKLHPAT